MSRARTSSILAALIGAFSAVACSDANETSTAAPKQSQRILSSKEVRRLIIRHFRGFTQDQVDKMFCIAYAESNFDAYIESYAGARGLFQIMPVHTWSGEGCSGYTFDQMWNPDANAACAYQVYIRQGFDAWDPYYFAQRDPSSIHAQKYLYCRAGNIGWGE